MDRKSWSKIVLVKEIPSRTEVAKTDDQAAG
jgi:hypothetical protein